MSARQASVSAEVEAFTQCYDCGKRYDSDVVKTCDYFPGGEPLCPGCYPRWS